jgi:YVTN family beta-propeller protein
MHATRARQLLGAAAPMLLVLLLLPAGRASANDVYVVRQAADSVAVIDGDTETVVDTIQVGDTPFAVALSPDASRAYVTNIHDDSVSVIDTAARSVVGTVTVGDEPGGIAVAPDGSRAYVANGGDGTVSVIDLEADVVVATLAVPGSPRAVALTPDGTRVYVAEQSSSTVHVFDTSDHSSVATVDVGADPVHLAALPDGSRVWVASAFGSVFDPTDGDLFAISTTTNTVVQTAVNQFMMALAAAPDGGRLYTAGWELRTHDPLTGAIGVSVPNDSGITDLAVSPDGGRLYVPSNVAGRVSVYDTATMAVRERITVGGQPMGIAVAPDRGPTARFQVGLVERTAFFDASHSTDPDREIVRYEWDFGDGTRTATASPTVSHVYASPGDHRVTLRVVNAIGCSDRRVFTGRTASCNGGARAIEEQLVTIPAAEPPTCTSSSVAVGHGSPTAVALPCSGRIDARAIVSGPHHGTLGPIDQRDGTVTYTPAAGFTGPDRIRFRATGPGGASAPATIALTVAAPPPTPGERVIERLIPVPAPAPAPATRADTTDPPRITTVRLSRRSLRLEVSSRARLQITISRCRRKNACRTLKRFTRRMRAKGRLVVRFGRRLPAGRMRVVVRAVDGRGRTEATARRVVTLRRGR